MWSKTIEPGLGMLINFINIRKINTQGIKQANKHILMATLTYNLKKFMQYVASNRKTGAAKMLSNKQIEDSKALFHPLWLFNS